MQNTPNIVARPRGNKHTHPRRPRSGKKGKPRRTSELDLKLDDAFFSEPPAAAPLASLLVEAEVTNRERALTTAQLQRRLWFRNGVKHLMAGMTAFTGFAMLVHIAQIG